MMQRTGIERIVVVQISVYGTDNSCMIDGMKALGDCSRGVVQVATDTPECTLDDLHTAGVRGVRVNLNTLGIKAPDEARRRLEIAAAICAPRGWHLQIFTSPPVIASLGSTFMALPVPVVIDHFGLLPVHARGGDAERVMLDLLASGQGWVKLSGTYRLDDPQAKPEIASLARDLHRTNPDNVLWGSDWPHPPAHNSQPETSPAPRPFRQIDPVDILSTIPAWFESPKERKRILVDNPARLYDFQSGQAP